jgi:hypothetical protein
MGVPLYVKRIKCNKEQISVKQISEGLSGTCFWAETKQIIGLHNTLPNTVGGVQGSSNIADIFQEKYVII